MRRLAALLVVGVALATSGCVFVVGSPFGMFGGGPKPLEETTVEGQGRAKILLLDVTGTISDEPSSRAFGLVEEESTVGRVEAALAKAADDDRVKAVVLRVNSPGGGVTASDDIHMQLLRFKREQQIPVIAALGDTAASGGYYVACAADRIVAHPTTVTGSIGVILLSLDIEGLMAKIGVRNETYKAGEHKDLLSPLRAATPEERHIVQRVLDHMHERFIAVVRAGRPGLDVARLPEITDGRIFDATQAQALGLVDDIGSVHDAIELAKRAAGLTEARVVRYARRGETAETIAARSGGGATQVNLLAVDLGALQPSSPRFMYLWAPFL
ncbi:MAG TPA: signal peptide peptidase SppA [Candidatus Binatia bacterium]|nr:signal peptide peptidase SppA [Candidatus Binatia bacterium]